MAKEEKTADILENESNTDDDHHAPGTFVLVILLLVSFMVYYFANWKALADVWHVR